MEQFEMAICGPKHILHTKIFGTADGAVGNLRVVASGGGGFV